MPDTTRIALVASVVPEYRLPALRLLQERQDVDLVVVTTDGGAWATARQSPADALATLSGLHRLRAAVWSPGSLRLVRFPGLRRLIRSADADVVVAEPRMGLLSVVGLALFPVRRRGGRPVPVVWWMAGWRNTDRAAWVSAAAEAATRSVVRHAWGAVCYGSVAAERAVRLGLPRERVRVAQNAIDTQALELAVDAAVEPSGAVGAREGLRLLYVGQLNAGKRLDLLLEVLADGLPEVRLRVVGDGAERERLEAQAHGLGLGERVAFIEGTTEAAELAAHMRWADLGILPHLGGLMLNTCMAARLPVLCGDADGTEIDLVEDGVTGFRFSGTSAEGLRRAIVRAYEARDRLGAMGEAARRRLRERASLRGMVDAIADTAIEAAADGRRS